jgi:hypothetical protein
MGQYLKARRSEGLDPVTSRLGALRPRKLHPGNLLEPFQTSLLAHTDVS